MAAKKTAKKGKITRVAGPVIHANMTGAVNDLVRIGKQGLLGEIIEIRGDTCIIQVYEDTTGLTPGDAVENTNEPLQVQLGPGLLGGVFDGTQRPLDKIQAKSGIFIARGVHIDGLDMKKKWAFTPAVKKGDKVSEGAVLGTVKENALITHQVMVPPGISGKVTVIKKGQFTVKDAIATVGGKKVSMMQKWPVRKARPYRKREIVNRALVCGTRVLDFLFPVAKGGVAAIPGPFGAGKTVTQQQFAKWSDADIIVYIGCGERGNEMTEVLSEFPHLVDPKSGLPLMNRTILIANTSNMPVAAREASVYTGIAIAEYFRDQGFAVALMADSTSRWAEAMREISGRLEEMPGEEGYPAYLSKRLAEFYERAGSVEALSGKKGSISVVGAVSPPGGDFSEPVTQNTLRLARCFWALDSSLAGKRHFPSINWLQSYSLYTETLDGWFDSTVNEDWSQYRQQTAELLQKEAELQEIVQLVGIDSLPKEQQALLFVAKMIREDFLQQNAFHEEDTFCSMEKQFLMIEMIFKFYSRLQKNMEGVNLDKLRLTKGVQAIGLLKYTPHADCTGKKRDKFAKDFLAQLDKSISEAKK